MAHPFAHRAHFNSTSGQICHCPWGHGHLKTARVVEASKLDFLRDNITKGKNAERNKYFLKWMENNGYTHPDIDKMLPWVYNQFKGSKLLPTETGNSRPGFAEPLQYPYEPVNPGVEGKDWFGRKKHYESVSPDRVPQVFNHDDKGRLLNLKEMHGRQLTPETLREWQHELDYAGKKGRGVNIDDYDAPELDKLMTSHRKQREEEEAAANRDKSLGDVVHQFPNGWTMRQLQNIAEMEDEGAEMGHCVGNPEWRTNQRWEEGNGIFHSLRDENNVAHATIEHKPDWGEAEEYDPDKHYNFKDYDGTGYGETEVPRIGPNSKLAQFYGKQDAAPIPQYEDMVNEWLKPHGLSATGGNQMDYLHGWAGEPNLPEEEGEAEHEPEEYSSVEVPAATNMHDYHQIHGEGNYWDYLDHGYGDGTVGENTEIYHQDPEWEDIAGEYMDDPTARYEGEKSADNTQPAQTDFFKDPEGYEGQEGEEEWLGQQRQRLYREEQKRNRAVETDKKRKQLFDTANDRGETDDMREAMEQHMSYYGNPISEEYEPEEYDDQLRDYWHHINQWKQWEQEATAKRQQQGLQTMPMMKERPQGEVKPTPPPEQQYQRDQNGDFVINNGQRVQTPAYGPEQNAWQYIRPATEQELGEQPQHSWYQQVNPEKAFRWSAAGTTAPLYHRWVYSPTKGVTLGTNQDDHPAMVKYHQELGGDINDTDLTHGYAYPIINGWRLSDLDHQPVGDPYIVNQVVRALNGDESPQGRSHEGSWQPVEYDWTRIHYGLPQEKSI